MRLLFMMMKQQKRFALLVMSLLIVVVSSAGATIYGQGRTSASEVSAVAYMPLIFRSPPCPETSNRHYAAGWAFQIELDDPVRPAWNHADKNLDLRGYTPYGSGTLQRELVDYGSGDPNQPPQFATLFKPARVPELIGFYQIGQWDWAPSPDPGERGAPISGPKVTALGLKAGRGEPIHVPSSGYDIGGGMEVLVLYADENSVTLRYTRDDSSGPAGYSVFIDRICTDPNLLALYRQLDDPNGPRYNFVPKKDRPYVYDLPNLPAGQAVGTVRDDEVVVAISDTGRFWDPRSCNEWWQIRPGYTGSCPASR